MAKIVMIAGFARSLVRFRGDLIQEMVKQGHEVITMAPEKGFEPALRTLGAEYQSIPLVRNGMNPLQDLHTFHFLVKKMRDIKPDIVFSYTAKPVIYGSLAAGMANVGKIYSMITGLGYAFTGESWKQRCVGFLMARLYQMAAKLNQRLIFQNPDDLAMFQALEIVKKETRTTIVNGSGVDIEKYASVSNSMKPLSFLLIGRLIWDKGIGEYVEAARLLKNRYPQACFRILGPLDGNPNAVTIDHIRQWQKEQIVEYLGRTDDVRPYLEETSVYVLPSYREGTPRSVLEAMAMSRPIITTDAPGCRETVIDGVNGYLVPVKDAKKLASAMEKFIVHPELIPVMGRESRQIAVEKYDVRKVTQSMLQAMELVYV